MGAEMTIKTFPLFELTDEREARILASLDRRKFKESGTREDQFFTMKNLAPVLLEMICEKVARKRSKGDDALVEWFTEFCTNKTVKLMDAYAIEDHRRAINLRLSVECRTKKSSNRGVRC